jgi:hypothetical protein
MKRALEIFLVGSLAFGLAATGLSFLLWPDAREVSAAYSASALALCLLPCTLTLAWALGGSRQTPEERRLVVLGGTSLRMFFVLGVGLLLTTSVPYFRQQRTEFWIWVLMYYLFTLGLEVVLVVRQLKLLEDHAKNGPPAETSAPGA